MGAAIFVLLLTKRYASDIITIGAASFRQPLCVVFLNAVHSRHDDQPGFAEILRLRCEIY